MAEKNMVKWDFQKDGKPFDELPSVVKGDPRFLYEYMRTGELPNIDLIEELIALKIKAAKNMINEAKKEIPMFEDLFNMSADKRDYKAKEFLDKIFIESRYINMIISFGDLWYERPYDVDGPLSIKKVVKEVRSVGKVNNVYFSNEGFEYCYARILWSKTKLRSAENKLKELEEYDLL